MAAPDDQDPIACESELLHALTGKHACHGESQRHLRGAALCDWQIEGDGDGRAWEQRAHTAGGRRGGASAACAANAWEPSLQQISR